jgi:hypothetical protein
VPFLLKAPNADAVTGRRTGAIATRKNAGGGMNDVGPPGLLPSGHRKNAFAGGGPLAAPGSMFPPWPSVSSGARYFIIIVNILED